MRLESQNASTTIDLSHSATNFVQNQFSPPSNFRSYQPNSRGRCFVGGHGYHHSGSVNKPLCQTCGKAGHIAFKCFHSFDVNFQNPPSSSNGFVGVTTTDAWFLDSGATHHVTADGKSLNAKTEYSGIGKLSIGDGSQLSIYHTGNIKLPTSQPLMLRDILLVPSIAKNLISISKFTLENDVIVEFDSSYYYVKDKQSNKVLLHNLLKNGLYELKLPSSPSSQQFLANNVTASPCSSCNTQT